MRTLREDKGLKQIEVATAAGMNESQVSDIERGKNEPGWRLLQRMLTKGLEASLSDLEAAYERIENCGGESNPWKRQRPLG